MNIPIQRRFSFFVRFFLCDFDCMFCHSVGTEEQVLSRPEIGKLHVVNLIKVLHKSCGDVTCFGSLQLQERDRKRTVNSANIRARPGESTKPRPYSRDHRTLSIKWTTFFSVNYTGATMMWPIRLAFLWQSGQRCLQERQSPSAFSAVSGRRRSKSAPALTEEQLYPSGSLCSPLCPHTCWILLCINSTIVILHQNVESNNFDSLDVKVLTTKDWINLNL